MGGGGWESESLRVCNTRQESGNGARAENWVSICASIWDQNPRLGPAFPAIAAGNGRCLL